MTPFRGKRNMFLFPFPSRKFPFPLNDYQGRGRGTPTSSHARKGTLLLHFQSFPTRRLLHFPPPYMGNVTVKETSYRLLFCSTYPYVSEKRKPDNIVYQFLPIGSLSAHVWGLPPQPQGLIKIGGEWRRDPKLELTALRRKPSEMRKEDAGKSVSRGGG